MSDILHNFTRMPLEEARAAALEVLESIAVPPLSDNRASAINKRARINKLIRDIKNERSSASIGQTMWNLDLAGAGLKVSDSAWQRAYKEV
jgi:hypothetical protein